MNHKRMQSNRHPEWMIPTGILFFKVNNGKTETMSDICKELIIRHQNDVNDVVSASLWVTWNRFHTLIWCFYCWIWISKYRLGSFANSSKILISIDRNTFMLLLNMLQTYEYLQNIKLNSFCHDRIMKDSLHIGLTQKRLLLFHDGGPYDIETNPLICFGPVSI